MYAGASGGVYCLISAQLATLILNWRDDKYIIVQRVRPGKIAHATKNGEVLRYIYKVLLTQEIKLSNIYIFSCRFLKLFIIILYTVGDMVKTILNFDSSTTSWEAHLAGATAGLIIGFVVLKNRRVEAWNTWLKVTCKVVFIIAFIVLFVLNLCITCQGSENEKFANCTAWRL